ncbi:unnamed protein product [Prunus brigantina]
MQVCLKRRKGSAEFWAKIMGKTLMCGTRDPTTLHNMMNPPGRNTSKVERKDLNKKAIIFIYKRTPRNWRS